MKNYINIKDKTFGFSSCDLCDARCCDGTRGTVFSEIVLDEFTKIKDHFPIVFVLGEKNFLKPVVLLSNGNGFCRYVKDHKCTVYENRPTVCRTYPLSPHITNDVYIDISCPAIGEFGDMIVKNGHIKKSYDNDIFQNYQDKFINTIKYFDKFNKKENLQVATTINNITFYRFKSDMKDEYLHMHLESLECLDKYYHLA